MDDTAINKLITKIHEHFDEQISGLLRRENNLKGEPEVEKFFKRMIDLYINPDNYHANGLSILFSLNGFENGEEKNTFLHYGINDPISFIRGLEHFVGNALLDDGAYYISWKCPKMEYVEFPNGSKIKIQSRDGWKWVWENCEAYKEESIPVIYFDSSGEHEGHSQDAEKLNKIVNWYIGKEEERTKKVYESIEKIKERNKA